MDLLAFILAISAEGITDEQVQTALNAYIAEHPEAVTTVTDGSITKAKLDSNLQATVDDVGVLKSAINSMSTATTSDEGKALKAKTVANGKVTEWEFGEAGGGITSEIKTALLACFANVAWANENGQDYYDALESALNGPAVLLSISAVYTQTEDVITTDSLDSLRADLVVTGTYDNQTTRAITDYTLTGMLTAGTSTITVNYSGKTATFNVSVTEIPSGYTLYDYITRTDTVDSMMASGSGILTDIGFSTDLILETQFRWDDSTRVPANPIMGIRGGQSGTKEFGLFYLPTYNRLGYWYDGTDSSNTEITTITSGVVHTIKVQPVGVSQSFPQNATINVDGVDYNTNSTGTGVTFDSWLGFFKYGTSATTTSTATDYYAGGKIGRTIIRNTSGTILHDLRPAYNGEYYGLYDVVGEKFYYYQTASMYTCANWE